MKDFLTSHQPLTRVFVAKNVGAWLVLIEALVCLADDIEITSRSCCVDPEELGDVRVLQDPELVVSSHMFTAVMELSELLELVLLSLSCHVCTVSDNMDIIITGLVEEQLCL